MRNVTSVGRTAVQINEPTEIDSELESELPEPELMPRNAFAKYTGQAEKAPASAPVAAAPKGKTIEDMRYGQELTMVIDGNDRPLNIGLKLAKAIDGNVELVDQRMPNGPVRIVAPSGNWIVEKDNAVPGVGAVFEIKTPPLTSTQSEVVGKMVNGFKGVGDVMRDFGGGHIHIDGDRMLAQPAFLSRFLLAYLDAEPDILNECRHPARTAQARGFSEKFSDRLPALRADFAALAEVPAEKSAEAVGNLIEKWDIHREMAVNLRSLAGVMSGNKKSKGTLEIRLFDAPKDAATVTRQREIIRELLAKSWDASV